VTSTNDNFLGLEPAASDPASARYAVLPIPYEGTATYMKGTAAGPAAILAASRQVELFDEELLCEFARPGVATYPPIEPADDIGAQMARIKAAAAPIVSAGRFLLSLGGEHSITVPLVQACAAEYGEISVLQIDAHADLRDSYLGTRHSHACVMRRVLETTPRICQVGVRSYSPQEYLACPGQAAAFITPRNIARDMSWVDKAIGALTGPVYVTVDMDGLDPSIAPGVGTPEPGGLTWQQVLRLLRRVCASRRVIAADIVEVRPIPPNHVTEYVAARLACKIIAYTQQATSEGAAPGDGR
jgi:agmatinase